MNIWNTVFLVLILLLAAVGVFFTGQEMKIQKEWRTSIANHEKKIVETEKKAEDLLAGSAPTKKTDEKTFAEMGLEELKAKLQILVFERNKAWFGCQPGNVNVEGEALSAQQLGGDKPPTAADKLKTLMLVEVKLTVTEPKNEKGDVIPPDGLSGVVYLFDEGQERVGGSFLGRFTVKSKTGNQVTLISANELNDNEIEQIKKSVRSTWAVYLAVPTDRQEGIFDRLTSEELEALIPKKEIRKEFENKDRPLQDFDILLTAAFRQRVQLQLDIDSTNRYIVKLNESIAISNKEQASLRQDIETTKKQVAEMEVQRKAVESKLQELDATIGDIGEKIKAQQWLNQRYVEIIAECQMRVAEHIEKKAEEAAAATK